MSVLSLIFHYIDYVNELVCEVIQVVQCGATTAPYINTEKQPPPLPLCSNYEHPNKLKAIDDHRSRFKSTK